MFKLESYITPLILSYADKYIRNFKLEDSQVSLWGGDASFHNLDLRLEVLEQELQLPFSFVSGHIHELSIHVPWTKLTSEPILITINTIECILKLRSGENIKPKELPKEKPKKPSGKKNEVEVPPGYVQSLISKIVNNIRIYCNNLILKYVEEDIVLSMNVKLLTYEACDEKWEPKYVDYSPAQVTMRKLITVNDLTVCLDKRNSSGKIDVYQDPMLYRCSLVMHFIQTYQSANTAKPSTTRFDIYCNNMEFSVTELQIPMVIRLILLASTLGGKDHKSESDVNRIADEAPYEVSGQPSEMSQSWAGWMWSLMPSISVPSEEDSEEQPVIPTGHTLHIGLYIDTASLAFKVSESNTDRSYYAHRKLKYWSLLLLKFQGIYSETIIHGLKWMNASAGIGNIEIQPLGFCTCGFSDAMENHGPIHYFSAGEITENHKADSLFDAEAVENKGKRKLYNISWEYHVSHITETTLLDRTAAFAMDFIHEVVVPEDMESEQLSDITNLEYSNIYVRNLIRVIVGPMRLKISAGLIHRIECMIAAASAYDYPPYAVDKPSPPSKVDLQPPSTDDYDSLNENIPMQVIQLSVIAPVVEVHLFDHPKFQSTKENLFRKRKKLSAISSLQHTYAYLPKFTIECQCIDVKMEAPIYTRKLVHTVCQLPDPPPHMFEACYEKVSVKVMNFCSKLILEHNKSPTIITPLNVMFESRQIISPEYWTNPDITHTEMVIHSDSVGINCTKPRAVLVAMIIEKLIKMSCEEAIYFITNSSLLQDAMKSCRVYLEFCIEEINLHKVSTNTTLSINISLSSIKAFIFDPIERSNYNSTKPSDVSVLVPKASFTANQDMQQVLFISGPDTRAHNTKDEAPLLLCSVQFPLDPGKQTHPSLVIFNLQEIRICIDPLLCRWFLYRPVIIINLKPDYASDIKKIKGSSEVMSTSTIETPRRIAAPHESVHSSSDRERGEFLQVPKTPREVKEETELPDMQERVYNFLTKWFTVWKGMLVFGDLSQCTIYLPTESLSAVGSQGIQNAVDEAMISDNPPDMLVITLPSGKIRSAGNKESILPHTKTLPIKLPQTLWSANKSNFPWSISISDISCYTWQSGAKLDLLKPLSFNATVGMCTKNKQDSSTSIAPSMVTSFSDTKSLGTLGVCIHVDMSPTKIILSEVQVCLIASILYGLIEVMNSLLPDTSDESSKQPEMLPVINAQPSSGTSPTLLKESTLDSASESSPHVTINTDNIDTDHIKLTAWIQWTIAKFTIELLSYKLEDICRETFSYKDRFTLKLVVEAEDLVSSLDFQSVFMKLKSKIGSASIQHYQLDVHKGTWQPGPYLGFIMKTREEEVGTKDQREDTCFANIIITRASCQHTHDLWGTSQQKKSKEKEDENTSPHPSRFISEIVVKLQPIDFVFCLSLLRSFLLIFEPLFQIPSSPKVATDVDVTVNLNSRILPLAYVDCKGFRVIVPSTELGVTSVVPDVCIFQVEGVGLHPDPGNPICRTPIRADIYQQAARSRLLTVPGSEIEDRQYELKISGISLSTSMWANFDPVLNSESSSSTKHLKTMSENPALEWNLGKESVMKGQNFNYVPIINKFDILIVAAPAIIYKNEVICGHSVEINYVSNIEILISLSQIKLVMALTDEMNSIVDECLMDMITKRPKVFLPYIASKTSLSDINDSHIHSSDMAKDSGFETTEIRSLISLKSTDTVQLKRVQASENVFARPSTFCPYGCIPVDFLVTAGKISFTLYDSFSNDVKDIVPYSARSSQISTSATDFFNEKLIDEVELESVSDASYSKKIQYKLFVFLSICQLNMFMSHLQLGHKVQVSCYNLKVKVPNSEQTVIKTMPTEKDFDVSMVETRTGYPNPNNGVLPAFFTMRWSKGVGMPTLEMEVAKPVKIVVSVPICAHLINVANAFSELFSTNDDIVITKPATNVVAIPKATSSRGGHVLKQQKSIDNFTKFREIKEKLLGVSLVNIKLAQVVFKIRSEDNSEISLIIGKIKNHLNISNRPERITNVTSLNCISLGVSTGDFSRLLINPWTISVEVCLFWESWQSIDADPQIQISADSDIIIIDISPEHLQSIEIMTSEITKLVDSCSMSKGKKVASVFEDVPKPIPCDKEQHYKDDLRAGAFHFVDSTNSNIDELPLSYQVMLWSKNISAMAWRYPQPRALTKIRVFPIPFKMAHSTDDNLKILCHLEYWSDCHGSYQPYTQFHLSESEMCHLELPQNSQPTVACIWRIVLTSSKSDNEEYNYRVLLSPRALAGCIRVDSYFNKVLIPQLTLSLHITKISVNMYSRIDKSKNLIMPDKLKQYTPDQLFPETQNFMIISLDNTQAYVATWISDVFTFDLTSQFKCLVLDYGFLTLQPLIHPFTFKFEGSICNSININFISKPIMINIGATVAHTLAVSGQLWSEHYLNQEDSTNLIIMTQYVVCNDTNVSLRFGQVAGNEDILLLPRYCHFYAWRSQKGKLTLRVALEEYGWVWSEPFRIDSDGTEVLGISKENDVMIIVTVKSLSGTQKKVTFSGQLVVCNTLTEHFELKVVENVENQRDSRVFKNAPVHIIGGKSAPPSILLQTDKKYSMRLRFYGLDAAWSGDIPLVANPKCVQPWLVKVPLQERGQFLSIWCQIETQSFKAGSKILAILSPLFMVRSHLPISTKVQIDTPMLNVQMESNVRGKGEYQQLYCLGTIDHSHQLTFQLDDAPTSNTYVPLNYSLVDQKEFFKKKDKVDIDEIVEYLSNYEKSTWPYFGDDFDCVEFSIEEQPLTHVQVRYQNACQYSSALLVELSPLCMLLNTTGCPIAVMVNEKELCRVSHYGICTPLKLEETFYLGIGINETWNLTPPLQLAKSNWGTAFYMPKISGNIPSEGGIKIMVKCEPYVCMMSIFSRMENGIRMLQVGSTHVITNHTTLQLYAVGFAVPVTGTSYSFPKKIDKLSVSLPPNSHLKFAGVSVIRWYVIGKNIDPSIEYVFYITFSETQRPGGWSCPIRVDKPFHRRNISLQMNLQSVPLVLVSQEDKGQSYLSLHYDTHPQLQIINRSGIKLFCAQFSEQDSRPIVDDCEHMKWLCSVEDESACYYTMPDQSILFPEPALNAEHLVFASDPEGDPQGYQWSQPVHVTNINDQFIRIPYYGDIKVTLTSTVHTTVLSVESVTQVERSARDIRVRLSRHEVEPPISTMNKPFIPKLPLNSDAGSIRSAYFSAEDKSSGSSNPDTSPYRNRMLNSEGMPTLTENSNFNPKYSNTTPVSSDYDLNRDPMQSSKGKDSWNNFKAQVFIKALIVTLTSDLENSGAEKMEFCALTCDNIAMVVNRTDNVDVHFSIGDMQIDNQLYHRESFDFPVLLIGQKVSLNQPLQSLTVSVNQLITNSQKDALISITTNLELWTDPVRQITIADMTDIFVKIKPLAVYVEDAYILKLVEQVSILSPANLVITRKNRDSSNKFDTSTSLVYVPAHLIWGSKVFASAISLRSITIEPLSVLLSVHCSIKLYVALDESPLEFGKFSKKNILTTSYRLGNAITMHYLSGAIFGAGWIVGSLELLGSPGGLARAMGVGLKDFVNMPYQGLLQGPWAFLVGITYGCASLMRHVTAGTLQSVTKLASSVARNLDRMTMDEEHLRRTEEQRRQRPQSAAQGLFQGLTGLGINLLGAIGGIAHHPIQSMREGASPRSLATGVGLGLVGIVTKPLSGAADLVALTGQGLLQGAGWNTLPYPRTRPLLTHVFTSTNSVLKYTWKFTPLVNTPNVLFLSEATLIDKTGRYEAVTLILTTEALMIASVEEDVTQKVYDLDELFGVESNDPTMLALKVVTEKPETAKVKSPDDCPGELDPVSKARIQDYVRNTVGFITLSEASSQHSEISISPDISVIETDRDGDSPREDEQTYLNFFVNPQSKNYFLCILSLAKQQHEAFNFPVL